MMNEEGPVLENPCLIVPRTVYDKREKETQEILFMKEYIPRVITEKKELDTKIRKLEHFINESPGAKNIKGIEQANLEDQLYFMKQYSFVLGKRISNCEGYLK